MYSFLYEQGFLFHLDKYLGVESLSCIMSMVRLSKKLLRCFPKEAVPLCILSSNVREFHSVPLHPCQHLASLSDF